MKQFDIGGHLKSMLWGFADALYGAVTAGLIGASIYGFYVIPSEGGYVAVLEFVCAIAALFIALAFMYLWGKFRCNCNRKKIVKKGVANEPKQMIPNK